MAGSQVEIMANQVEDQRAGFQAMSLTEFDSLLEPQIEAGSVVEIAGALFEFTALESITGWAGIANSSYVYVKLVVAGTSVTAAFTTVAPTWAPAKQGWYNAGETERYVFYLRKNAGGDYALKSLLLPYSAQQVHFSFNTFFSSGFTAISGDRTIFALNLERFTSGLVYTKLKEVHIPFSGTVKVRFRLWVTAPGNTVSGRIYVNGVAVGTARSTSSGSPQVYTEDISVVAGDLLQLYGKISSVSVMHCDEFAAKIGNALHDNSLLSFLAAINED